MEIIDAVKYYVLKNLKVGKSGFFDEFDIEKFIIKKIDDNMHIFSYEESSTIESISNNKSIFGIITKDHVEINAKKEISTLSEGINVSFTIIKNVEYKIINYEVIYSVLYTTLKKINNSINNGYTESIERYQKYEFKDGNFDFLNNYKNLLSKKWPIIKNSNSSILDKKLVKKC